MNQAANSEISLKVLYLALKELYIAVKELSAKVESIEGGVAKLESKVRAMHIRLERDVPEYDHEQDILEEAIDDYRNRLQDWND